MVADVYGKIAAREGVPVWHGEVDYFPADATNQEIRENHLPMFDWTIESAPVCWIRRVTDADGNVTPTPMSYPKAQVLYHSETGHYLSTQSNRFVPHQPRDVRDQFITICDGAGLTVKTAGMLQECRRFWMMASTGLKTEINSHTHEYQILIATSCDGTLSTWLKEVFENVVCSNTLGIALGEDSENIKQKHMRQLDIDEMVSRITDLDFAEKLGKYEEGMRTLANFPVSLITAEDFFRDLLHPRTDEQKQAELETEAKGEKIRKVVNLDKVLEAYVDAPGASPGNAYGLVQAATFFRDHVAGRSVETRRDSAFFGQGAMFKARAYEQAHQLVAA